MDGFREKSGPHCAPAPRTVAAYVKVPDGNYGEFRWPGVFFAMEGQRHTKHKVKSEGQYRAQLDKGALIRVLGALISDSALPQPGVRVVETEEPRTQQRLAERIGLKCRESFNRNLRKSPRMLKKRINKFAKACVYTFMFGEGEEARYIKKGYRMPRAKEMAQHPEFGVYWSELKSVRAWKRDGDKPGHSDYHWVPGWIFHVDAPGGPLDRLVLLVLACKGLFDINPRTGRMEKQEVQISEMAIAAALGIHRDTVSRALHFWKSIGLISIQEQKGHWELAGKPVAAFVEGARWRQAPNKIWYLPGKEFNEQQALEEANRFAHQATRVNARSSPWWKNIAEIHAMMLKNYIGKKHTVGAFWRACRAHMAARGVPDGLIDSLFPRPPD